MLYLLAMMLKSHFNVLNVLTYHTVRAGSAALTGFVVSVLLGPAIIAWLRALKVGQYIREEHVADLHALHKDKAGTPTMGGALIIVATVVTLLLWGRLDNRLLICATGVLCALGAVGFVDDFIKLRRKHNQGLTAKTKFTGQIIVGLVLGAYLVTHPITVSATRVHEQDIVDWPRFIAELAAAGAEDHVSPRACFVDELPEELQRQLPTLAEGDQVGAVDREAVLGALDDLLKRSDVYDADIWQGVDLNGEATALVDAGVGTLEEREVVRLNRMLLEIAFPDVVAPSVRNLHTKVEVPGFKAEIFLISLGVFYVLFVVLILVASSNAVNLTDGLDGLAIGASVISLLAYTGIAYVVSRADWSDYLLLISVPEASELAVFGATLVGTGLGFLWFNCHPAEVFMGDTGSLALGGAIGTMAILTKQELLLLLVGGLFVVEAASVIIQIACFKLWHKRVFRMAPLHHHFELSGWSETKVVIRFWIVALLFAMMSLSALKLR